MGEPDQSIHDVVASVQEAMLVSIDASIAGMRLGEVDVVHRKIIGRAAPSCGGSQATCSADSIGIAFAPDWGKGLIMSICHRDPRLLQPNISLHTIPRGQLPERGGIGLLETIRVTAGGCEVITQLER